MRQKENESVESLQVLILRCFSNFKKFNFNLIFFTLNLPVFLLPQLTAPGSPRVSYCILLYLSPRWSVSTRP